MAFPGSEAVRRAAVCAAAMLALASGCGDDDGSDTTAPTEAGTTEVVTTTGAAASTSTSGVTSGDPSAGGSEPPPGTAGTTTTSDGTPAPDGSEALTFFRSTEEACAAHAAQTGNPVVEPERFAGATVDHEVEAGMWRIVDGSGVELTVDLDEQVIYGTDGPDGLMPNPYSFGCPPELYVGGVAS